ncbi:hypothetical protein ACJ41O_010168 [Fusarium nematophilum]
MVSKGHCKFDLYDEDSEFRDFYDFSSDDKGGDDEVGDDSKDGQDLEEEADGAKGAGPSKFSQVDGSTLRLPREESFATRQLVCLSAKDRHSLIHLPLSQQLAMLAVRNAQIAKARRAEGAERAMLSRVETRGNKNLMKHFVNDVPRRLNS